MSKDTFLSFNLFLSIFGIFLSFYYFGTRVYHYPIYELNNILTMAVFISSILILPIIIANFFFKRFNNLKILKKIYNSLVFGTLIYITYHYLIRFVDVNYFFIYISNFSNENIFFKIIFYLYPFIIFSLIHYYLKENILKKINTFIFILLIIFNSLSINRIIQIYGDSDKQVKTSSDLKFFKPNNKIEKNDKKIFFLIFDTFDQYYLEKNIDSFENLKSLYETSYVNKNFYTPAKFTLDAIPAILTGNSVKKTIVTIDGLYFYNLENKKIKFNYENSIFNQKGINNFTSSIIGFYHPYCRIFIIKNCYDTINFSKNDIKLINALDVFFKLIYVDKFFDIFNKIIVNKDSSEKLENIDTHRLSKFMYENSENFINIKSDLIFIHYPYPHLPLKTKGIIKNEMNNSNLSDYEKNLFLIDLTLKKIQSSLNKYENSLLIVTSDHWFKEGHTEDKAHPSVFFSKIIGDNFYIEDLEAKNLSSIKKLITNYLNDEIKSNNDIRSFFIKEKNHGSYVR